MKFLPQSLAFVVSCSLLLAAAPASPVYAGQPEHQPNLRGNLSMTFSKQEALTTIQVDSMVYAVDLIESFGGCDYLSNAYSLPGQPALPFGTRF